MSVEPGWHIDPADPATRRYWDGEGWLGAPIPADATPPDGPPPDEPETPPDPVSAPGSAQPTGGQPPSTGGPVQSWSPTSGGPPPAAGAGHPSPTGAPPVPPLGGAAQPPPFGAPPPGAGWPPSPTGGPPPGWPWPGYQIRPPEPRPHGMALAGFGPRLIARLIDFGIVFLLNAVVNGWFVWQFIQEVTPLWREILRRSLAGDSSTEGLPQPGEQVGGLQVAILLIATALWFAYEVPALANGGQTLGKRVMRIKVLPIAEGQQLGFGRAFRRWNTLGLPTLLWYCCGFGLLLQLVDALSPLFDRPLRQALHDKRAQTVVVQLPLADNGPGSTTGPIPPAGPGSPSAPTRPAPHDRADPSGDAE